MEIKHLWKVYIDDYYGHRMVITYDKDIEEAISVVKEHNYEEIRNIEYIGEVLS